MFLETEFGSSCGGKEGDSTMHFRFSTPGQDRRTMVLDGNLTCIKRLLPDPFLSLPRSWSILRIRASLGICVWVVATYLQFIGCALVAGGSLGVFVWTLVVRGF